MAEHKLDFHATFRKLSFFRPSLLTSDQQTSNANPNSDRSDLEKFILDLLSVSPDVQSMNHAQATNDWMVWFQKYADRVHSERDEWLAATCTGEDWLTARQKAANGANPRFVLRQWVLEEVIKKVESDAESGKKVLGKVLQVWFFCPCLSFVLHFSNRTDADNRYPIV
jgi:serine/tyrosine/threonine adenylyltransferase